jgi:hypothetical protein
VLVVKWTYEELLSQRRRLDPEQYRPNYILGVFLDFGKVLSVGVRTGEHTWVDFYEGDSILHTFMASNNLDKALLTTLIHTLSIDARTALEMCLS